MHCSRNVHREGLFKFSPPLHKRADESHEFRLPYVSLEDLDKQPLLCIRIARVRAILDIVCGLLDNSLQSRFNRPAIRTNIVRVFNVAKPEIWTASAQVNAFDNGTPTG